MTSRHSRARAGLRAAWWGLWPAFTALAIRLGVERGCGDAYDLLPALAANPAWAWPIALMYVAAHVWIIAVYLVTVSASQRLAPGATDWRAVWGRGLITVQLMVVSIALENAPLALWRTIATAAGCGR